VPRLPWPEGHWTRPARSIAAAAFAKQGLEFVIDRAEHTECLREHGELLLHEGTSVCWVKCSGC
jgi:hypothetical protein